jgi:hypothetical protein
MRTRFLTALMLVAALAVSVTPAAAQHRGGGVAVGRAVAGPHGGAVAVPRGSVGVAVPRGAVVGHAPFYPYYPFYGYGYPFYGYPYYGGVGFSIGFGFGFGGYYGYPYGYFGYGYPYYPYGGGYGYPYGYSYPGYGYTAPPAGAPGTVSVEPGTVAVQPQMPVPNGGLRIQGAARDAQVYVDGNYAGVVDDMDGSLQHLNLPAGNHRIEVRPKGGAEPISFDVTVRPGETVTYKVGKP